MKKKLLILLVAIVSCYTLQVNAKQFYASEKVLINEQQEYSVFAAGDEVKTNSFIDGAAFIAGFDVEIASSQDVLFTVGEEIKISGAYTKDAFIVGTELEIENSEIRDLFAFAEEIKIKSPITHNAYLAGTKIVIDSEIMGNLSLAAEKIELTENAKINGTLKYPEYAKITVAETAVVNNTKTYKVEETNTTNMMTEFESFMMSYISILVVGFIMLPLFKKLFTRIKKEELSVKNIAKKTAIGFAILIVAPIAVIVALISLIGMPLSLILLALYIMAIYTSIIPSGYFLASKMFKDKIKNEYLLLVIGIAAIKLLEYVPVIGGFIALISLCLGISLMLTPGKKTQK